MASASWKLCSMSGLHTPSASAADISFSSSLASPTSRCLASAPPEPLVSGAPAAVLHGDAMVPAASAPLAIMEAEDEVKGRILINCQFRSKFKEYTLIGMRRMAQRIPTTHATNAHLVCAYADTTSRTLLPLPRVHPVFFVCVCVQSGQT